MLFMIMTMYMLTHSLTHPPTHTHTPPSLHSRMTLEQHSQDGLHVCLWCPEKGPVLPVQCRTLLDEQLSEIATARYDARLVNDNLEVVEEVYQCDKTQETRPEVFRKVVVKQIERELQRTGLIEHDQDVAVVEESLGLHSPSAT